MYNQERREDIYCIIIPHVGAKQQIFLFLLVFV